MKDFIIVFLFAIIGAAAMIWGIKYLREKSAEDHANEVINKVDSENPCDSILSKEIVFNGMWIGMPKSEYKFKSEIVRYQGEGDKGNIEWTPTWYNDTLVKLRLNMSADLVFAGQGYELTDLDNQMLARSVWHQFWEQRLRRCNLERFMLKDDDNSAPLLCGRIGFEFWKENYSIIIYDRCFESTRDRKKQVEDSLEIAKSKKMF